MTLPNFNAEQSLYRSSRHYRSSALAGVVGGIRPSDIPPPLSYQATCVGCCFDGFDLKCYCRDVNGNLVLTSLLQTGVSVPDCGANDIANCNGQLTCGPCP